MDKRIEIKLKDWATHIEKTQSLSGYSGSTVIARMVDGRLTFDGGFSSQIPKDIKFSHPSTLVHYFQIDSALKEMYQINVYPTVALASQYHPETSSMKVNERATAMKISVRKYYRLVDKGADLLASMLTCHKKPLK